MSSPGTQNDTLDLTFALFCVLVLLRPARTIKEVQLQPARRSRSVQNVARGEVRSCVGGSTTFHFVH
jgi:hypothetical protein